jgi:hypothetical protein
MLLMLPSFMETANCFLRAQGRTVMWHLRSTAEKHSAKRSGVAFRRTPPAVSRRWNARRLQLDLFARRSGVPSERDLCAKPCLLTIAERAIAADDTGR